MFFPLGNVYNGTLVFTEHKIKVTCVVRHRHKTHTENSKPSNRNELLPQSPPFHAKGRRSTDPITNARAKVRTAPGMALDTVKSTFQSIVQTPPFNTKQDSSPSDRPRKTKLLAFFSTYNYYNYLHK